MLNIEVVFAESLSKTVIEYEKTEIRQQILA